MVIDNHLVYTIIQSIVSYYPTKPENMQILMISSFEKKVATGYPGVEDPIAQRNMINGFLDYAQQQQNVWIVTNQQLLAWMRNPVPVSVSCTSFYSEVLVSLSHLRC